jgi:hypothetical protein
MILSYLFHAMFAVFAILESLMIKPVFPVTTWKVLVILMSAFDIAWVIFYSIDEGDVPRKIKASYSALVWTISSQVVLCSVIILSVAFVNMEVVKNGVVIMTDDVRFKEYLVIYPVLTLTTIPTWIHCVRKMISYYNSPYHEAEEWQ